MIKHKTEEILIRSKEFPYGSLNDALKGNRHYQITHLGQWDGSKEQSPGYLTNQLANISKIHKKKMKKSTLKVVLK